MKAAIYTQHLNKLSLSAEIQRAALVGVVLTLWLGLVSTTALARGQRSSAQLVSSQEIYLTVSQYELALIQTLSEICPPMLNGQQRTSFYRAYTKQLQLFMPRSTNPQQSLRELSAQQEYRVILQNVRAWTASYPAAENRALCREFAGMA